MDDKTYLMFLKGPPYTAVNLGCAVKALSVRDGQVEWEGNRLDPAELLIRLGLPPREESEPDILFVAFGMGKQEKWIYENLAKMPSVRIAMGVGGAFDYISGNVSRAPRLLRKFGLEWVYRLFKEPRRIGRIFNATIKFISYVFRKSFR